MRARLLGYGIVLLVSSVLGGSAFAVSTIGYLDHPLPKQIRDRAEALVRALRPQDADEAVEKLRTVENAESHLDFVIIRVEADCHHGR